MDEPAALDGALLDAPRDFFISRAGADAALGQRVAEILRDAGKTVLIQEDFGPAHIPQAMAAGLDCRAMVALVSRAYQQSDHCVQEYGAWLHRDPLNRSRSFYPLLVEEDYAPTGPLGAIGWMEIAPLLGQPDAFAKGLCAWLGAVPEEANPAAVRMIAPLCKKGRQIRHEAVRPSRDFAGRQSLIEALDDVLSANPLGRAGIVALANSREQTATLRGLGGVGKTALAREYAWRRRDRYHGVWWIRADSEETLVEDLAALGARLIGGLDAAANPRFAAAAALEEIAQAGTERPWLLVYDDLDDPALLRRWTPGDQAHVLITSRRTGWDGDVRSELDVGPMTREEAVAFLLARARRGDGEAAGALADALGCLPLALAHARSYCWGRNWGFDQYLPHVETLMRRAPKGAAYPESVFATFSLAIDEAEAAHPFAAELAAGLAYLAPDAIPFWLLPEDAADPLAQGDALAALSEASLVEFEENDEGGEPLLATHRMVQAALRGRLTDRDGAEAAAEAAVRRVEAAYDGGGAAAGHGRNATLLPHAVAVAAFAPTTGPAAWSSLWNQIQIGDLLRRRGAAADGAYLAALEIARAASAAAPADRNAERDVAVCLERLGDAAWEAGEHAAARGFVEERLAVSRRLAEAEPDRAVFRRDLSIALNKLGDVLMAGGDAETALAVYQEALAVARALALAHPLEPKHGRDVAAALDKIGTALARSSGADAKRAASAQTAFEQALAILRARAAAEPEDLGAKRDVFVALLKLSELRLDAGAAAWAYDAFREALGLAETLADAAPDMVEFQRDVAVGHERVGEAAAAMGDAAGARAAWEAELRMVARLRRRSPGRAEWPRFEAGVRAMLAGLGGADGEGHRAEAIALLAALDEAGGLSAADQALLAGLRKNAPPGPRQRSWLEGAGDAAG